MLLLNKSLRRYREEKARTIEHLPLAQKVSFQDLFIRNLNFPDFAS